MSRSAWAAFAVLAVLMVANLAYTWHIDQTNHDRLTSMRQHITTSIVDVKQADAASATQLGTTLGGKLDRNWKMAIVARKAACGAYTNTVLVPHYLYASECNLPNMQPKSTYIRFWREPQGWNTVN